MSMSSVHSANRSGVQSGVQSGILRALRETTKSAVQDVLRPEPANTDSPATNQLKKDDGNDFNNLFHGSPAVGIDVGNIVNLLKPNLDNLSIQQLDQKADSLRAQIKITGVVGGDVSKLWRELGQVNNVLELRSLEVLEEYMVSTQSGEDNVLEMTDLGALANSGSTNISNGGITDAAAAGALAFNNSGTKIAAEFLLANQSRLNALDVAGSNNGTPDGMFGLGDIHARQLEINADVQNLTETQNSGDGSYQLPNPGPGGNTDSANPFGGTTLSLESPPREQSVFDNQQDAIEDAVRTGEDVNFVNSDGELLVLNVQSYTGGTAPKYNVSINGHNMSVTSELGLDTTIAGIANIVEYGSTLGVAEGIRQYPDSVLFDKGQSAPIPNPDGSSSTVQAAASYDINHQMVFYGGDDFILTPQVYNHEIGHGIATDLNYEFKYKIRSIGSGPLDFPSVRVVEGQEAIPSGWPAVHDAASASNDLVSDYAASNYAESFAEAFAAYTHAKNHGEAELNRFREAYPRQAAFLDANVFGITSPPT